MNSIFFSVEKQPESGEYWGFFYHNSELTAILVLKKSFAQNSIKTERFRQILVLILPKMIALTLI